MFCLYLSASPLSLLLFHVIVVALITESSQTRRSRSLFFLMTSFSPPKKFCYFLKLRQVVATSRPMDISWHTKFLDSQTDFLKKRTKRNKS